MKIIKILANNFMINRIFSIFFLCFFFFLGGAFAQNTHVEHSNFTKEPDSLIGKLEGDSYVPEIQMYVGESKVFPTPGVQRIAVGNRAIMEAAALDEKEVIIFANAVGVSSLFVWNDSGKYQSIKINILPGDTSRIAREIGHFLSFIPKARSHIVGDKIIVEGDDLDHKDLKKIEILSKRYPQIINFTDPLEIDAMIMMDVKVVEFPITRLKELGLKWSATGGVGIAGIWSPIKRSDETRRELLVGPGSPGNLPISPASASTMDYPSGIEVRSGVNLGIGATLNLLEQTGETTILASPQLSARNGAKASFLAGGEYPYVVSTVNGPTVNFKPYGVKLDVQPTIDSQNNIRAVIRSEVSTIDRSVTTPAGPGLTSKSTETEFQVKPGQTIVLSGFISRERATGYDKIPGLGDIPVIGRLFRSKRFLNKETELVFFVTPSIVTPKSPQITAPLNKIQNELLRRLGDDPYFKSTIPGAKVESKKEYVKEIEAKEVQAKEVQAKEVQAKEVETEVEITIYDDGPTVHDE